jgi:hypothetical protein
MIVVNGVEPGQPIIHDNCVVSRWSSIIFAVDTLSANKTKRTFETLGIPGRVLCTSLSLPITAISFNRIRRPYSDIYDTTLPLSAFGALGTKSYKNVPVSFSMSIRLSAFNTSRTPLKQIFMKFNIVTF